METTVTNEIAGAANKENGLNHAATVVADKIGIVMDVYTQDPGLQFYEGNFM